MGLFSKIVTRAVGKIAEETVIKQVAEKSKEQEKKQQPKARLFKSWRQFVEVACVYFFASQFIYIMALFVIQVDDMSFGVFYQSCAMASFISIALFLLGMIAYGLYRIDMLPLFAIFFMLLPIAIMAVGFSCGFSAIGDFFLGAWMNSAIKLIFFLLGLLCVGSTLSGVLYYESEGTKKKAIKQTQSPTSDEEAELKRSELRTAIQENAITVRFAKRKWNFSTSAVVMFGYDEQNKQFIFVSDKNSYTLSSKKVVYFDFEDIPSNSTDEANDNEPQRLIKLFYLSSTNKESVVSLTQVCADDEAINRIKYYANNSRVDSAEGVFRRKIRHIASALEGDFYPRRPFVNDEWFEQLKECMEKIKNNNTDGYSLLKERVVSSEDYMDDEVLAAIVGDFSIDPPDQTSAKKEAKRLCRQDFNATLKASVKNFFSAQE